jgi:glucuronate isomerase
VFNFLLNNKTADKLYHDFAEAMPLLDYHNHQFPEEIAAGKKFIK